MIQNASNFVWRKNSVGIQIEIEKSLDFLYFSDKSIILINDLLSNKEQKLLRNRADPLNNVS